MSFINQEKSITPTVAEWILKNIKLNNTIFGGENGNLHSITSTEINCKKINLQYIISELLEMLEKLTEKYYMSKNKSSKTRIYWKNCNSIYLN